MVSNQHRINLISQITLYGASLLFFVILIFSAGCDENGGTETDPNAGADEFFFVSPISGPPCDVYESTNLPDQFVVGCTFVDSAYPLSISELIDALNGSLETLNLEINNNSRIWIEALGGKGAKGEKFIGSGGNGGGRGYARTAQRIKDIINRLSDGDSLYMLVGSKGSSDGGGGASSIVIGQELADIGNILNPTSNLVFVISGGGGGGGGGGLFATGKSGGGGGNAIALFGIPVSGPGSSGNGGKRGGKGGNLDKAGSGGGGGGSSGSPGIGGLGGKGNFSGRAGWGIEIAWDNGMGGNVSNNSVGAGGGGGYGGGGGSDNRTNEDSGAGAGGGGSWARQAAIEDEVGSFLGKDNMPSNSDNGSIVFTIETFSTE